MSAKDTSRAWPDTHAVRNQVFWAQRQPWFFLNTWCPNIDGPFQRHRHQRGRRDCRTVEIGLLHTRLYILAFDTDVEKDHEANSRASAVPTITLLHTDMKKQKRSNQLGRLGPLALPNPTKPQ